MPKCKSCGLDFKAYARKLKEKRAAQGGAPKKVRCPQCKTVQPMGAECVSCGLDFKEYARKKKAERAAAEGQAPAAAPTPATAPAETSAETKEVKKPVKKSYLDGKPVDIIMPKFEREPELSSVGELLGNAWLIYKDRAPMLMGLFLLSSVLATLPGMIGFFTFVGAALISLGKGAVVGIILFLISLLVGATLSLWPMTGLVSAAYDETQGFREAMGSGWRHMWALAWLYMVVGYLVQGGLGLLVIPGIIWWVSFFGAKFVIFDGPERGVSAALKSRAYVQGHWRAVFWRVLLASLILGLPAFMWQFAMVMLPTSVKIFLIPMFPFILGAATIWSVVFVPFMFVYLGLMFKELKAMKGPDFRFSVSGKAKAAWLGLATAGILLPIVIFIAAGGITAVKNMVMLKAMQSITSGDFSVMTPEMKNPQKATPRRTPAPTGPEANIEPEINVDKLSFVTGERIVVHFKAPSTFAENAWVGIVPTTVPHGSETINDRNDVAYQYLSGRTSGDLVFTAPEEPGIYDIRMNDADEGGKEVASTTIAVESGTPPPPPTNVNAFVTTIKQRYSPLEAVEVEFSGLPGNDKDWITVVDAKASSQTFGEWFYTGGLSSGRHTFKGLRPGMYEVRVYYNWPDGGYQIHARHSFRVVSQ